MIPPRISARLAGIGAALLLLGACTVDPIESSGPAATSTAEQSGPIRIAVITHGDDGGFWSIVRRGARDAADVLGVQLDYQGSAGNAKLQAEMINAAIIQGAQGLAVSAPDIGAISSAVEAATARGIPVVTLNSGADLVSAISGVITHVGQSETLAGERAGEALGEAGARKVLCILHEVNNIGLQERCAGAAEGLARSDGGRVVNVQVTGKADPSSTAREVGAAIEAQSPDAVLTLDPDIAMAASKETKKRGVELASFDLSPAVLTAIEGGDILFTVDQQPYLQGYLPVVFLELAVRNRNEVGAGNIVLTGPSLVTKENAAAIASLSAQGTR